MAVYIADADWKLRDLTPFHLDRIAGELRHAWDAIVFLQIQYIAGRPYKGDVMIEVTKINGVKVLINPDLLELAEETPDTVLTFTTGRKLIVKESRQEVKNLVKSYRKDIFAD